METRDKNKRSSSASRLEFEASSDALVSASSPARGQGRELVSRQANRTDMDTTESIEDLGRFREQAVKQQAGIKVIGVGGGGCNAVNSMVADGMQGVQFVAINTDEQSLIRCEVDERIHIGKSLTRGLGAGSNPEVGRKAIEESKEEVLKVLEGTDMVFITAGMGGGTGTGAAPIVAQLARQVNALTVAVVTKPFSWEGRRRMRLAEEGIEALRAQVDAIIIVPNDSLLSIIDTQTRSEAFELANDVLRCGVQGISEIITIHGEQNVDFADVRAIMSNAGSALLGIGVASGDNRAEEAARLAISSPLWEGSIDGATGVLFNIVASSNFTMRELEAASNVISDAVDPDANIIWGSVTDDNMEGEVRITVVATGFPQKVQEDEPAGANVFNYNPASEEVAFAPAPQSSSRNSEEFLEPAILRRARPSIGG